MYEGSVYVKMEVERLSRCDGYVMARVEESGCRCRDWERIWSSA